MSSKNYYGLVFRFHQRSGILSEYRAVINLKERNVGPKEKSPKQGLASAKDQTVKQHEGRDSTYHRLAYNIWMERFVSFCLPHNLTLKSDLKSNLKSN